MYIYVTGSIRNTQDPRHHGRLIKIDWNTGEIIAELNEVFPTPFCARNSNPRGGTRGWRGIIHDSDGYFKGLIVANNDSLVYFDYNLNLKRVVTHPAFGNIHGLYSESLEPIYIASTLSDIYCCMSWDAIYPCEPLASLEVYQMIKEWLKIRTRDRQPFNPKKDYREEWIESTLHLNYVLPIHARKYGESPKLIALFNSMNLLVQLQPKPEILWSAPLELGQLEAPLDMPGLQCPHDLVLLPDGDLLINSSARQELYRFNLNTKELKLVWKTNDKSLAWNRGLALMPNKKHVLIGTGSGAILEVDIATGKEIKQLQVFENKEFPCSIFGILVSKKRLEKLE